MRTWRAGGRCTGLRAHQGSRATMGLLAAMLMVCVAFCAACVAAVLPGGMAYADEYSGRTDWTVIFTADEKMTHTPENMNLADAVSDMQPGDVNTVAVTIKNEHAAATDWYMTNEVIRSLEESVSVAHGSGYGYVLKYKGPSGQEKVLFNSDEVGGESSTESDSGEGLHEATSSLEDWLYLDELKSGEHGLVTLQVSLDGETNNNAYQDTLADIKMNFAVELADASTASGTPGTPGTPGSSTPSGSSLPKTGDYLDMLPLLILGGVGGVALLILAFAGCRLRREQETAEEGGKHAIR